jgi:hemerythrin
MMLAHGFDGHAAHRSEHQRLLKQIYLVDKDISSGRIHLCQTLELFVQVWIEQHILSSDRQFAEFLKSKGVD